MATLFFYLVTTSFLFGEPNKKEVGTLRGPASQKKKKSALRRARAAKKKKSALRQARIAKKKEVGTPGPGASPEGQKKKSAPQPAEVPGQALDLAPK